ncbi:hypothetical protein AB0B52_28415 [Streptomyces griseofuscus]|uniref:hypothetical protein n=1 Tax=Streptomyces griseofuscus TaxID=146922 RepID=UPI0033F115B2
MDVEEIWSHLAKEWRSSGEEGWTDFAHSRSYFDTAKITRVMSYFRDIPVLYSAGMRSEHMTVGDYEDIVQGIFDEWYRTIFMPLDGQCGND